MDLMASMEPIKWDTKSFSDNDEFNSFIGCFLTYHIQTEEDLAKIAQMSNQNLSQVLSHDCSHQGLRLLRLFKLMPIWKQRESFINNNVSSL